MAEQVEAKQAETPTYAELLEVKRAELDAALRAGKATKTLHAQVADLQERAQREQEEKLEAERQAQRVAQDAVRASAEHLLQASKDSVMSMMMSFSAPLSTTSPLDGSIEQAMAVIETQARVEKATEAFNLAADESAHLATRIADEQAKRDRIVERVAGGALNQAEGVLSHQVHELNLKHLRESQARLDEATQSAKAELNAAHLALRTVQSVFDTAVRNRTFDAAKRVVFAYEIGLASALRNLHQVAGIQSDLLWDVWKPTRAISDAVSLMHVPKA